MQEIKVKKITLQHKAGADVVAILANAINADSLGAIREAVSNSIDANSKKVEIKISGKEVIIEDWGSGIEDVKDFVEYGSASKVRRFMEKIKRGRLPIGQFHLGKLSYFKLADTVHTSILTMERPVTRSICTFTNNQTLRSRKHNQ
jgi:HSP90 family molecular chaperone